MNKTKIWISSPHMGGNEMTYIKEAFDTNWIAPLGRNVTEFENTLQEYLGNQNLVACLSSGTSAMHIALILAGVTYGDTVLCQSFTFCASANPVKYLGAMPIFIDSEKDTWNICPELLEEAIIDLLKKNKKPKAVIIADLYGMPAKLDEILAITTKYDIKLIEDAAEAIGSTYKRKKCGTFGDFGILSFNGNKIITTSGGGGIVCKTENDKKKAVFLATQARDEAPHYEHSQIGYNYRMSNITAGIGRGQMEVLDVRIAQRRENNFFYRNVFSDVEGIKVSIEPSEIYFSNFWLTSILIDEKITGFTREDLRISLASEEIESRPLWKPLHLQPIYKDCKFYGTTVSENLFNQGLCLPSGSNLQDADLQRVKETIFKNLNR